MRADPGERPWSSYRTMLGQVPYPRWLAVGGLLSLLAKRRSMAVQCYARFVTEGQGLPSIWMQLNRQELLGEDAFVRRTRAALQGAGEVVNIPRVQRRPPVPPLTGFVGRVVRVRAVPTGES